MVRCDGLLYDLLWGVPLSALKVYTIWLPWWLIFKRIQKCSMYITDWCDRNFGVDFLFFFFDFYLKSLDSPNIFNYRCYSHKYASLYQTPGISNQALVFMRVVKKCLHNGRIFWQKVQFFTTPLWKKWFGPWNCLYPWNFLKNLQSGIVFMVVQALHNDLFFNVTDGQMLTLTLIYLGRMYKLIRSC